jgi:hypothetical protein
MLAPSPADTAATSSVGPQSTDDAGRTPRATSTAIGARP